MRRSGYTLSLQQSGNRATRSAALKPLHGIHIVEFEGLGPGPLAGRMLADMGARVTVVERPGPADVAQRLGGNPASSPLRRGKQAVALDLKTPAGREAALALVAQADGLIEGFRPGVMERLGLGPADCAARRPALVYGRMTGWGQDGPLAARAGHDLNYVALSGLLDLGLGDSPQPPPPTALGDAGGALGLAFGMVSGLLQAQRTGQGCVVDAAIGDMAVAMGALVWWMRANGQIDPAAQRGCEPGHSPFHDSPFYDLYLCADGRSLSVAALEAPFYKELLQRLDLHDVDPAQQYEHAHWPALKARLRTVFASQPLAHWVAVFEGSDACVAPVLMPAEAALHPHHVHRQSFVAGDAAPAPRLHPLPLATKPL